MAGRAKSETIELNGSHAIFISHPKEIAALIERAAKAAKQQPGGDSRMATNFRVGDHVRWKSEHVAMHRGAALRKIE